jgi:hypothetical protein
MLTPVMNKVETPLPPSFGKLSGFVQLQPGLNVPKDVGNVIGQVTDNRRFRG